MHHLVHSSNSEMLSWPNSPLLVLLHFVGPNVLLGDENAPLQEGVTRETPIHHLADLADPSEYFIHVNQLILAKQLVERGANTNASSSPHGLTPLHKACYSCNVTSLDFIEYLLVQGADPNHLDYLGRTPLLYTIPHAPGAAKFLLYWPTTDANITTRSGMSFLARVRKTIRNCFDIFALTYNPDRLQHQFVLQQWREIEAILVERGAADTGIAYRYRNP
jgi:hypothetical protein